MSRRVVQAIDVVAFTVLIIAGLMIAAGVASAQEQASASARKIDRPAVTASTVPVTATVATLDAALRTTTLVRSPADY